MNVEEMSTEELLDVCLATLIELGARYPRERMFARVLDKRDVNNVIRNFQGWRAHV